MVVSEKHVPVDVIYSYIEFEICNCYGLICVSLDLCNC